MLFRFSKKYFFFAWITLCLKDVFWDPAKPVEWDFLRK